MSKQDSTADNTDVLQKESSSFCSIPPVEVPGFVSTPAKAHNDDDDGATSSVSSGDSAATTGHAASWLITDKDAAIEAVRKDADEYIYGILPCLRSDKDVTMAAIISSSKKPGGGGGNYHIMNWIDENLRDDKDIILTAISSSPAEALEVIKLTSKRLRSDKEVGMAAVTCYWGCLEYLSYNLRGDRDIIRQTISSHQNAEAYAMEHAARSLKEDKEFILEMVSQYSSAMKYIPPGLLEDKDVALAAISNNHPTNLTYFSQTIKDDKEVVLTAIEQASLAQVDVLLEREAAIRILSTVIEHISDRLKGDKDVMMRVLRQDGRLLRYASPTVRQDKECVILAASTTPEGLKYALGGLNQDKDCLIAAGIWNDNYEEQQKLKAPDSSSSQDHQMEKRKPKIVLSTRFSLDETSTSTATNFTVLLKQNPYICASSSDTDANDIDNFDLYSPNAFGKDTCDPEWTRLDWPCRGTFDTCRKEDPSLKTGKPKNNSCWRYSFRYQLQQAKETNGFMVQAVEFREVKRKKRRQQQHKKGRRQQQQQTRLERCLGMGQQIESEMANDLGVKIFQIYQPGDYKGTGAYLLGLPFQSGDIDTLVSKIKEWYSNNCEDMGITEIYGADRGGNTEEDDDSDSDIELLASCPSAAKQTTVVATRSSNLDTNPLDDDTDTLQSPSAAFSSPTTRCILCSSGHVAILHTGSIRYWCDICGDSIEPGNPMHGCRECNWDACLFCTDEAIRLHARSGGRPLRDGPLL